ncbi:CDGSH iron-sulfur domain-containing protein [Candidatus Collierbacteria bacterium]|nr:CDGSH iron-sulfur domain-containing protein [Candidatus Collierbacteria bacterium]
MSRLVQHNSTAPVPIKSPADGSPTWICQCGLSKNQPLCDGSHQACKDEDSNKLYEYNEKLERNELSQSPRPSSVYKS